MALEDNAVVTAAVGYVFTGTVGQASPTPAEVDAVDPERYGCQVLNVTVSGSPESYVLTVGTDHTAALPFASTPDQVLTAVEALPSVGVGNLIVEGTDISADGFTVTVTGALQGTLLNLTGTATGGTSPEVEVTVVTAPNGWDNIGHTSRDDMPEFAFDGGDTAVKGTWQRKNLRTVLSGDPVADSVTINLNQWTKDALTLYYGEDAANTPGVFGVDGDFTAVERAILVIIVDGDTRIAFYAAKASVTRADSINMPVDDFAELPIKATFLKLTGRRLYDWISLDTLS